jgi:hypothetical protein
LGIAACDRCATAEVELDRGIQGVPCPGATANVGQSPLHGEEDTAVGAADLKLE